MENDPSELTSANLEKCLVEDSTLVDYFNTFLSLPCFPQRIFYNKELHLLEQFTQKLARDENNNVQISLRPQQPAERKTTKHGSSYKMAQISYCVTVLDKKTGFDWLKKYRLPEFLKSKLYAEYKLSKILSLAQDKYIEIVRQDIARAKDNFVQSRLLRKLKSRKSDNMLQKRVPENDMLTKLKRSNSSDLDSNQSDTSERTLSHNDSENGLKTTISCETHAKIETNEVNNYDYDYTESPRSDKSHDGRIDNVVPISNSARLFASQTENLNIKQEETNDIGDIESQDSLIRNQFANNSSSLVKDNYTSNKINGSLSTPIETKNSNASEHDILIDDVMNADVGDDDVLRSFSACDVMRSDVNSSDVKIISDVESSNHCTSKSAAMNDSEVGLFGQGNDLQNGIEKDDFLQDVENLKLEESNDVGSRKGDHENLVDSEANFGNVISDHDSCERCNGKGMTEGKVIENSGIGENQDICDNIIENAFEDIEENRIKYEASLNYESSRPGLIGSPMSSRSGTGEGQGLSDINNDSKIQSEVNLSQRHKTSTDSKPELIASSCSSGIGEGGEMFDKGNKCKDQLVHSTVDYGANLSKRYDDINSKAELAASLWNSETGESHGICENIGSKSKSEVDSEFEVSLSKYYKNTSSKSELVGRLWTKTDNDVTKIFEENFNVEAKASGAVDNSLTREDVGLAQLETNSLVESSTLGIPKGSLRVESEVYSDVESLGKESLARGGSISRSSCSDESEEEKESVVDLSTKEAMDKLKEYLVNTKGKSLLVLWLDVEMWKHEENVKDQTKIVQEMKHTFLRNGSPLELPDETKRRIKLFLTDLREIQRVIIQPLHTYWCPRFTLHQLRASAFGVNTTPTQLSGSLGHEVQQKTRKAWPDIHIHVSSASNDNDLRNSSVLPPNHTRAQLVARPQSCTLPGRSGRARKDHMRSKSAQSRILTTPYHTNAGEKQLQLYATPPPEQFGFNKSVVRTFPAPNDVAYISPVRLVINPLCKARESQTAWVTSNDEPRSSEDNSMNTQTSNMFQESLVEALTYKSDTGNFFKDYVEKQNNKLWQNCLLLWQALMEYSSYFENDTLDPVLVNNKAQWIYARFLPTGSECDVKLALATQAEVKQNLDPAYEDAFDVVEEHVVACLKEPWDSLCRHERQEYDMVPKKETLRYLEFKMKETKDRSKRSIEESDSQEESQRERGKYSIEEANRPIPVPKDGVTFETVIKDRDELEGFQRFLEKKDPKGVKDLMAWTDMETFQRIPKSMEDKRNKKAREIRQAYLNSRYFFGPDSPATKEAQSLILSMNGSSKIQDIPSASLISECQKYVRCRIERRWLALYKESEDYKERQNPKQQQISEAVEDIMLRRRLQRSEAAWRVLNSRWVSSSRDIVALRQTLNNPESCLAFRKFVSLKGETYENDVLFWVEVQKYKDLCHRHASEKCVKKKVQAITECFITSSIPPELQIDVPIEMAEKLMERITSRNQTIGPYLFREVQMTVFRVLFNLWKEFCTFRSTISEDKNIVDVLDKKLRRYRLEARLKRESHERRRLAKQEAEKRKKEREEKERKDLKSMEQLMTLMAEPSLWDREEEDVVFWRYSKHVANNEGAERKRSMFADTSSLLAYTTQPSMATKSTFNMTGDSLDRSGRRDRLASKPNVLLKSHGSGITNSLYSNESGVSKKTKKSRKLLVPKITEAAGSSFKSQDFTIDAAKISETNKNTNLSKKQRNAKNSALLKNRRQKDFRKIPKKDSIDVLQPEQVDPTIEPSGEGKKAEGKNADGKNSEGKNVEDKNTEGKDSEGKGPVRSKSRKRSSVVSNVDYVGTSSPVDTEQLSTTGRGRGAGRLRTNVLRQQWMMESQDRVTSPVPLTSESLKDFTNSPEGAPLDIPLPLIRISESQSIVGERPQARPTSKQKAQRGGYTDKTYERTGSRRRNNRANTHAHILVPDVIVN